MDIDDPIGTESEWDAFGCVFVLIAFGLWLCGFLMGIFLV